MWLHHFLPLGEITWVRRSLTQKLMVYHHLVFHENCHNLGIHKPFSITPKHAVVDQLLIIYPTIIHCPYMCMCIYIYKYTYCIYIYIYIYMNIPWNPILNAEKHPILTSCQSHPIDPQGWKLSSPPRERGEVESTTASGGAFNGCAINMTNNHGYQLHIYGI